MAYSTDLRVRVISYVESGGNQSSAASIFSVCERTIRNWISLKEETGSVSPRPHAGGYPPKIDLSSLKELVDLGPDKTLAELGEEFSASHVSVWHALKKVDYVYKKNSSL